MRDRRQARQKGRDSVKAYLTGDADRTLLDRLQAVDRGTAPIILRVNISESAALTQYGMELYQQGGLSQTGIMTALEGWLYGFQMGHDYVQAHGPLAGEAG